MTADAQFADYLTQSRYHPRSSAHGDRLCELLVQDLLTHCEPFRKAAIARTIVYKLNHIIDKGAPTQWNLDLVVGPPMPNTQQRLGTTETILRGEPESIWLAVDAKTIMTEHGKARRNRQRDLNSLHDILHRKDPSTIVGGLVVINMAEKFKSPLRPEITQHKNIVRIVKECIDLFDGIARSKRTSTRTGLDALGIIVLLHTNFAAEACALMHDDPAPKPGDPLHYMTFLEDLCTEFSQRFGIKRDALR